MKSEEEIKVGRPKGVKNKKQRKTSKKIINRKAKITEIFKDRTIFEYGLTKLEVLSLYTGLSQHKILNLTKDDRDYLWKEIGEIRKILNREHIISVTSTLIHAGTILNDKFGGFGQRQLKRRTFVFWRCSNMEDAKDRRNMLDKIAIGCHKSGNDTIKTVEQSEIHKIVEQPITIEQR